MKIDKLVDQTKCCFRECPCIPVDVRTVKARVYIADQPMQLEGDMPMCQTHLDFIDDPWLKDLSIGMPKGERIVGDQDDWWNHG